MENDLKFAPLFQIEIFLTTFIVFLGCSDRCWAAAFKVNLSLLLFSNSLGLDPWGEGEGRSDFEASIKLLYGFGGIRMTREVPYKCRIGQASCHTNSCCAELSNQDSCLAMRTVFRLLLRSYLRAIQKLKNFRPVKSLEKKGAL